MADEPTVEQPAAGGRYERQADGSLKQIVEPVEVPAAPDTPAAPPSRPGTKSKE